ncbi:uncharacterized protein LOC119066482 [Bradysia coprophila]|uniref:uncharacterized protein LOC119066482 n=1 Tax=Bradysia coprophila TaxID=38358 RepID=UPI00187DC74E|nr:uncharacterized protein LOC119066482 [Bradysia coprophila]
MKKLLFSVILSQMFITAFSIKCYQCSSMTDEGCDSLATFSPHLTAAYFKECEELDKYNGSKPFCRKNELEVKYPEKIKRTVRSCGWLKSPATPLSCTSRDYDGHIEVKCQCFEDGCNGSSQMEMFSLITLAVLNVLVFIACN